VSEPASRDKWAEWVLARRHATMPSRNEGRSSSSDRSGTASWRTLESALERWFSTSAQATGLIAFGAMPLVEESGRVVFCDVSLDLLDHCRNAAKELGVAERAEFRRARRRSRARRPSGSRPISDPWSTPAGA
jgi:hypothetical protein